MLVYDPALGRTAPLKYNGLDITHQIRFFKRSAAHFAKPSHELPIDTMTSVPRAPKRHRNAYLAPSTNVDDEDAITPCPPEMPVPGAPEPCYQHNDRPPRRTPSASSAASSTSSPGCPRRRSPGGRVWRELEGHFDPLDGTDGDADDTARLWRRMLAIQRAFGCYRSARMSAALEAGEDGVVRELCHPPTPPAPASRLPPRDTHTHPCPALQPSPPSHAAEEDSDVARTIS